MNKCENGKQRNSSYRKALNANEHRVVLCACARICVVCARVENIRTRTRNGGGGSGGDVIHFSGKT